jgi:uncharacterized membrane protein YeaQ/YmgE (transglycosylase-associated protein family)
LTIAEGNGRATKGSGMAVLGWIALGLVIPILASGFGRGEEAPGVLPTLCASGVVGAVLGGLVAVVTGIGPIGDFFHTGTWLLALGGTVLALVIHELARTGRDRRDPTAPASESSAIRSPGTESERLDRNW